MDRLCSSKNVVCSFCRLVGGIYGVCDPRVVCGGFYSLIDYVVRG